VFASSPQGVEIWSRFEQYYREKRLRPQDGTESAEKTANLMKKTKQILKTRPKLSLGDLIIAVSSCAKNPKETVAAVADLLGSGQVRVQSNGRFNRARVC